MRMRKILNQVKFGYLLLLLISQPGFTLYISNTGAWVGNDITVQHTFDASLAKGMVEFLRHEKAQTVADFGCGLGDYAKTLISAGIPTDAYDGNPYTSELSDGVGKVLDLSIPFNLDKEYEWVISIEVGEHLPVEFETIFVENLIRHAKNGLILSWAVEGQDGYGHFNCRNNDYIKDLMASYGFYNDLVSEHFLRSKTSVFWLTSTIMVFKAHKV